MRHTSEHKPENKTKRHICAGLVAHVDAGKTTLSEALLYTAGSIPKPGRVDNQDTVLDTYEQERARGITIFSKQAVVEWNGLELILLDTPGHVDFSAEMERTLQVLDYAVLVISGADGVQSHTVTLWRLLARYRIPVFLFVNKMDQDGTDREALMAQLREKLDDGCVDFSSGGTEAFFDALAMCGEEAMEQFLDKERVETACIRDMISHRQVFPCYFGSALKLQGVDRFLEGFDTYINIPQYPPEFAAKVFKIARDEQGGRLTFLKITGGTLKVRSVLSANAQDGGRGEKVTQIRIYSGARYEAVQEAEAGMVCAVTGLTGTKPGEGYGAEPDSGMPVLEPVLTYRVILPDGCDAPAMLPKLRLLEEEEPQLHIVWDGQLQEIQARMMGEIQLEILTYLIRERFGVDVAFGAGSIVYKETIADWVEGVGHYEPLRHYAEVHLLLEPGEAGSGMQFATACSEDILDRNWQRLVLTHLEEREHKGVLTGSVLTDMKITLLTGRAHLKHTEGGDFRQATYRAVRQGLMQARSVLLEPYYQFRLEVPEAMTGRAMTDIDAMHGRLEPPVMEHGVAVLTGSAPVAAMRGYQTRVTEYTRGTGRLVCTLKGYAPCHNTEQVLADKNYDPDSDGDNPSASVFCAHGAGFLVDWFEVKDYMHLESPLAVKTSADEDPAVLAAMEAKRKKHVSIMDQAIGTEEVDQILSSLQANKREKSRTWNHREGHRKRVYGTKDAEQAKHDQKTEPPQKGGKAAGTDSAQSGAPGTESAAKRSGRAGSGASLGNRTSGVRGAGHGAGRKEYFLVDGYNIIFAWKELSALAADNIDGARGRLLDIMCNYQAMKKCELIVVFDAYRVQGHQTEYYNYHNIHVVFTKEAETADQYIERFAHEHGRKYRVAVATSDGLEQIIIRGQGCLLVSARELEAEISGENQKIYGQFMAQRPEERNMPFEGRIPEHLNKE